MNRIDVLSGLVHESRLIHVEGYGKQWVDEMKGFQLVEPGKSTLGQVSTGVVNTVGKVGIGVTTALDRLADRVFNPNAPEPLRNGDFMPRTQRDLRQLKDNIFSSNALKHPIGTAASVVVRGAGAIQSFAVDSLQKILGGRNN
jgi:hypothetical protein